MTKILNLLLTSSSIVPIVPVATLDPTVDVTTAKEVEKENQDQTVSFKKQINDEKQKAAFEEKANWKKLIAQNRRQVNSITKYQYDNKEFYSKDELNEYMLKNNRIGQKVTSSNPNKIIKDTENMILDNSKIYDVDLDNATQLYRDAFGNIAYTREDALATYVTDNSAKIKYSYTGQDNDWHDSPTEAETQVKYGIKINKSLYYQFNGKFYNAFNKKDNTDLLETFAPAYYTDTSKRMAGFENRGKDEEVFAREDSFNDLYAKDIKQDFREEYYKDVVDLEQDYAINIKNNSCSGDEKGCYVVDTSPKDFDTIVDGPLTGYTINKNYQKKNLTFRFQPTKSIEKSEDIVNNFESGRSRYEVDFKAVWRGIYYKDFKNQNGETRRILWIQGGWWTAGRSWETGLPSGYEYTDATKTTVKVYLNAEAKRNKDQSKLVYDTVLDKPIYNINDLNPDTKTTIVDEWYKNTTVKWLLIST